ncbi:hypothetical protein QTO34_005449 [Cnephaeus nilssonii]|uniref:Ferritin n=1 Tax=Cnephaeus nilssonii TaxID=3371016 RepID=A0AA40HNF8_CNENI|nr:hypothetical protein QTO34_005449 [Eptesicus nilssonii]
MGRDLRWPCAHRSLAAHSSFQAVLGPPSAQPPFLAATQTQPAPAPHSPSECPLALTTAFTSQALRGRHQPPDPPGALCFLIYLSMSYYFDHGDVALKNLAKYFLHQSHEERECAEKLMKLQNQRCGQIFLQDIKKPKGGNWENWLNAVEYTLLLEKSVNPSLLELHKLATDKSNPHLCDFIETHYLNKPVKYIKDLDNQITNFRGP